MAIAVALAASTAAGDQKDARLDGLFEQLHAAGGVRAAQAVELVIWSIWIEHDDPAVKLLMENGVAAMGRHHYRAALEDFDQIVKIAPDYAEGWNKRATLHYLIGEYGESLRDIDRTLALEPRHFGALAGRGLVYAALDELELALESFEAALAVHPQMPGPRLNAEAIREELRAREI